LEEGIIWRTNKIW